MLEFLMGILEDLPPTLRQRYFRHDRTPAHREEFLWQWMNAKNRDVAWAWKTVCMTSVTVSNSDCFPTYGHLKEHIDFFLPGLAKISWEGFGQL